MGHTLTPLRTFVLAALTVCLGGTVVSAEENWQDHKLFPFSIRKPAPEPEKKSWLPRFDVTRNPVKPVTDGVGRSWDSVQRTSKKAWNGTKRVLTPSKNLLPQVKLPSLPKLNAPKLSWPSWGAATPQPQQSEGTPRDVGDWLRMPKVRRN